MRIEERERTIILGRCCVFCVFSRKLERGRRERTKKAKEKKADKKTRKTRQKFSLSLPIGGVGGVVCIPRKAAALVFFLPERKGGGGVIVTLSLSRAKERSAEKRELVQQKKREFETFSKGFDSRRIRIGIASEN